tara:strand:+ start:21246 stop:22172 length:927 start_codon:yes stop_codon:yes gene_type:complete
MIENLKDVLLDLGYSNISDNGRELRMKPIYRESSSNTVLSVRKDTGHFIDFSKQISGSFNELVKLSLSLSKEEADKWVEERMATTNTTKVRKPEIKAPRILPQEFLNKIIFEHDYWVDRGISKNTLKDFDGGIVKAGKMADRYVFPIFNYKKELVGVSGRDILNQKNTSRPKWKHIGNKSEWKYPLQINNRTIREERKVVLVESIGDMLSLWENNIRYVMVTFGLDVSVSVINYLLKVDIDHIYVSFNNDEENNSAGNIAAEKAQKKLLKYFDPPQVSIALPTKKDFGEMDSNEINDWKAKINTNIYA